LVDLVLLLIRFETLVVVERTNKLIIAVHLTRIKFSDPLLDGADGGSIRCCLGAFVCSIGSDVGSGWTLVSG
jgi:hypothetical protein